MSMQDDLVRLEEKVDEISEHVCSIVPLVQRADKEVFGNGRPGLSTQMADICATQRLALRVLGALGVAGLSLLGVILFSLFS